jgi:acetyltransferase-like isoleucine patch superfamily enzyme
MPAKKLHPSLIEVGEFSYGYDHLIVKDYLDGKGAIRIGSFCSIATGVEIALGGNHTQEGLTTYPLRQKGRNPGWEPQPYDNPVVTIGHDVWIGTGVSIRSGVTIGTGAIIASHSHVVRDVEPYEVVGGNPAAHIKKRFSDEDIAILLASRWWEHKPMEEIVPQLCRNNPMALYNYLLEKKGMN